MHQGFLAELIRKGKWTLRRDGGETLIEPYVTMGDLQVAVESLTIGLTNLLFFFLIIYNFSNLYVHTHAYALL